MDEPKSLLILSYCSLFIVIFMSTFIQTRSQISAITGGGNKIQTYIVHVSKPEHSYLLDDDDDEGLASWHRSFLPNATLDSGEPRLVHSYRHVITGFAARLTPDEAAAMGSTAGVLYTRPDRVRELATTYTHKFLGLSDPWTGLWKDTFEGAGMIIGVLDTGILPTHPSFSDDGMPSRPSGWNGTCDRKVFACNNKIIGAMEFNGNSTYFMPDDTTGHGTHVASIAAGNFVDGASLLGAAWGQASGMAPKAHLAIYKVCTVDCYNSTNGYICSESCPDSQVLRGIDQAISDKVDVISMSFGGFPTDKFYDDGVVLGSLAAVKKRIPAIAGAGNEGPNGKTLSHSAPWVLTVGASTTDRRIVSIVTLGNGQKFYGESVYQPTVDNGLYFPLVYPGVNGDENKTNCLEGSLDNIDVRGQIVICHLSQGNVVRNAGGVGMIIINNAKKGFETRPLTNVLPASHVSYFDSLRILSYTINDRNPTASITHKGTQIGFSPSPAVAVFSSRGPSLTNGGILKPDVVAPGVNILGAWITSPNPVPMDTKMFAFMSGTSMATPHVSGTVALLKNVHGNWSPAEFLSAVVTSAKEIGLDGNLIADQISNAAAGIFTSGAGQLNPHGAMNPGLVYDLNPDVYVNGYLCGLGYNSTEIEWTTGEKNVNCSTVTTIEASQLNYPSIMVTLASAGRSATVERTVKNVGPLPYSVYIAKITEPSGVRVDLSTYRLEFNRIGQELTFNVRLTLNASGPGIRDDARGRLEWLSKTNTVSSPIAISFT